jgi:hypothetical protein
MKSRVDQANRPFVFGGLGREAADSDDNAEHHQDASEDSGEVAGAYAGGRAERVLRAEAGEEDAEGDEHDAGPEVLLIPYCMLPLSFLSF